MTQMDYRWIANDHEDGPLVVEQSAEDATRLYRSMCIHDCLDLVRGQAIYRAQGETSSDDPLHWPSRPLRMRQMSGRWQTWIEQAHLAAWIREQELAYAAMQRYAAEYQNAIGQDRAEDGLRRLEAMKGLEPGWVLLADDVSAALDAMRFEPLSIETT